MDADPKQKKKKDRRETIEFKLCKLKLEWGQEQVMKRHHWILLEAEKQVLGEWAQPRSRLQGRGTEFGTKVLFSMWDDNFCARNVAMQPIGLPQATLSCPGLFRPPAQL